MISIELGLRRARKERTKQQLLSGQAGLEKTGSAALLPAPTKRTFLR
jgi:hypothetical protein